MPFDTIGDEFPRPGDRRLPEGVLRPEVDGDVRVARGAEPVGPAEAGPVGGGEGGNSDNEADECKPAGCHSRWEVPGWWAMAGSGEDYRGKRRVVTRIEPRNAAIVPASFLGDVSNL